MNITNAISNVFHRNGDDDNESAATPDALALIKSDHEEVSSLFESALGDGTPAEKRKVIAQIITALTVHAKMEETIFYPALRKAGKAQEKDSVLEAYEEHGLMKDMIKKLQKLAPRDETLKAKLTVLKEVVEHHVKEEESEMFDEARRVLGAKLEPLGADMLRYKNRALGIKPAGKKSSAKRSTASSTDKRSKTSTSKKNTGKKKTARSKR